MDINSVDEKMNNSIIHFEKELSTLRTSRANPSMLDSIMVDAYDSKTPIDQLGNISVPDSSTITIQVWDVSLIKNIESAIIDSKLGINPQSDGSLIRLPIPKLSEERRNELSKIASQFAENAKVVIRNIRRDSLDQLKKEEKDKVITQDDLKKISTNIQDKTDKFINQIDIMATTKKTEITKV